MSADQSPWPPVATEPAVRHPDAPPPGTVLGSHYKDCFGCGPDVPGGLRLTSTVGDGMTVHATFVVGETHQGAPGLAHGGLLTAAFDEALGALAALFRRPAVTGRLETDFRRPVPVGSTLHITARVDGVAGRKIYESAEGRLNSADGPVAVSARALFVVVGIEHFNKHGRGEAMREILGMPSESGADFDVNP